MITVAETVTLPAEKVEKLGSLAREFLQKDGCTAEELRSFIGRAESTRTAVEVAPLHYRFLQELLPPAQPWHGQRFLPLTRQTRLELQWWSENLRSNASSPLRRGPFTLQLSTDASSELGWGGHS